MIHVDISTEEKRKELYDLFDSFTTKREIFEYFGVCDNTQNTKIVRELGEAINFDFSVYRKRRYEHPKRFCKICGEEITGKDKNRQCFCSRSCAATYRNIKRGARNDETKEKIREGLRKYYNVQPHTCPNCGKEFYTKKKHQQCCSVKCAISLKAKKKNIDEKRLYRAQCSFKFSIKQFPEEFDIWLLVEHGIYKAANHGNNLNGVSRDHMFSINEGFKNHVDPYLLSHPANCKLLLQPENSSKRTHSSITYDELIERVIKWNKKYGTYPNLIDYTLFESKYDINRWTCEE